MNDYESKIEAEKLRRSFKEKRIQFLAMICDMALLVSLVVMFVFTQYTMLRIEQKIDHLATELGYTNL